MILSLRQRKKEKVTQKKGHFKTDKKGKMHNLLLSVNQHCKTDAYKCNDENVTCFCPDSGSEITLVNNRSLFADFEECPDVLYCIVDTKVDIVGKGTVEFGIKSIENYL